MKRLDKILKIRDLLANNQPSVGSWMQIPHPSVAEIMGDIGYDWVAVDMEHGSVGHHQLPDLFRALELVDCLPLVRLAQGSMKDCKQALDAGAGGVIVPMVENDVQLQHVRDACRWPPAGSRGVGFSRANLYGKRFNDYAQEAQAPLLIAMIENVRALDGLEKILGVEGLDAIMIGPYDLSASMGLTARFDHPEFIEATRLILDLSRKKNMPCGVHVVTPDIELLDQRIAEGYRFIAYSIDVLFLRESAESVSESNIVKRYNK